jgi:hypothetical protein
MFLVISGPEDFGRFGRLVDKGRPDYRCMSREDLKIGADAGEARLWERHVDQRPGRHPHLVEFIAAIHAVHAPISVPRVVTQPTGAIHRRQSRRR